MDYCSTCTQEEILSSLCIFDPKNSYNEKNSIHGKYWWEPGPLLSATGPRLRCNITGVTSSSEGSRGNQYWALSHATKQWQPSVLAKSREIDIIQNLPVKLFFKKFWAVSPYCRGYILQKLFWSLSYRSHSWSHRQGTWHKCISSRFSAFSPSENLQDRSSGGHP